MRQVSVSASGIAKEFNRRPIFRDIHFALSCPSSLAITGRNGSGKSTLAKIVVNVLTPTSGSLEISVNGSAIPPEQTKELIGFVSPYLNLYDEFSAMENLRLLSKIRSTNSFTREEMQAILIEVGLGQRIHDYVRTYSSGMKQRLKYAFALLHRPDILVLDEPTSNLDDEGVRFVTSIVERQKKNGILIVATNDAGEAAWCEKRIQLG